MFGLMVNLKSIPRTILISENDALSQKSNFLCWCRHSRSFSGNETTAYSLSYS